MTYISWILSSMMVYSTISSVRSQEYNALAFNPHTLEIYNLDEVITYDSDTRLCAVACPAKYEDESDIVKNISGREIFLFLQKYETLPQQVRNRTKCDLSFTMTALLHSKRDGEQVEFGFEVYFEKSKFQDEKMLSADFNEFNEISDGADHPLKRMGNSFKNRFISPRNDQRQEAIKKWGFIWIPQIEIRYDFSSRILKSLKYTVRPINSDQLQLKCSDYGLDETYTTDTRLQSLYEYENQREIFNKVKIPEGSCMPNNRPGECVKKHSLILPFYFQASSQNSISCSNMTTIPLWHEIPDELMDRIEKLLTVVRQVSNKSNEMVVITGAVKQLTLPSIKNDKPTKIYLDNEKKVPMPWAIYKLVRYKANGCREKNEESCWYDIVIFIHNYPTFTTDERLCAGDDETKWLGWDSIQYMNADKLEEDKLSSVYVCRLKDVAKLIGFPVSKADNGVLALSSFPLKYADDVDYRHEGILHIVEPKFKKLVEGENVK